MVIFRGIEGLITDSGVSDEGGDQEHKSLELATISFTQCSFPRGFGVLSHTDAIGSVKGKANINLLHPDG
jgi:hypothetical protein